MPNMSTPYRTPEEIAKDIPAMPKPIVTERMKLMLVRVFFAVLIVQGPLVAGWLHDACTPQHVGICWAGAILALCVTAVAAAAVLIALITEND